MPFSALQATLLQSAILGGLSNVLAQTIAALKQGRPLTVNWIPVFQFIIFNAISTPPNYLWQEMLERTFPAYPPEPQSETPDKKPGKPKLSKKHTAIKLFLDQTLSASFNTVLFSMFYRSIKAAMSDAPPESNPLKAAALLTAPGMVNFAHIDHQAIWDASKQEFWPILIANWKIWPAVVLFNFTMIRTVQTRSLVLALAGLGWRIYLSLVAAS